MCVHGKPFIAQVTFPGADIESTTFCLNISVQSMSTYFTHSSDERMQLWRLIVSDYYWIAFINKFVRKITLVYLRVYWKGGWAKVHVHTRADTGRKMAAHF